MTFQNRTGEDYEAYESAGVEPTPSVWKTIWKENKGALFIVISEAFGSSMDAIVRFLQQGGNSMHPLQVRISFSCPALGAYWLTFKTDHRCTYGHDIHFE